MTGELGAFIGFAAVTWTISAVLTAPIGVLIYLIRRFSYRAAFNIGLKENGYRGPVIPSPESF